MDFENFLSKNYKFCLIAIFIFAVILRWWFLPQDAVSFAYDQGRDAFIAKEIIAGDLKIQGPSSSTPGLFHGVLYYYVISLPYFLGNGNPVIAAGFLSLISALGIFSVFWLAKLLTKEIIPSLFASVIFAVSFEAVQYANFLSNASIGMWFVPFIYIGLYLWIKNKKTGPIICALALGLAAQSLITLIYHIVPVIFWLYIFRKKIEKSSVITFLSFFLLATFTMVITQARFGDRSRDGLIFLLTGKDEITQERSLGQFFGAYISQLSASFERTIFPLNNFAGAFIGWAVTLLPLYKTKIKKGELPNMHFFLASFVLSHVFALLFGGLNMRHILVGVSTGISVVIGIFIWKYLNKNKSLMYLALTVIIAANLLQTFKVGPEGQVIFPLQPDLVLSKELSLIDYTYKNSGNTSFSISTLTSPLFINSTWSYLYNWYGNPKYGYLPFYRGKDQVGQLGNNLSSPPQGVKNHFFIVEPTYGIPEKFVEYAYGEQNSYSTLISEENFGELKVQQRLAN